MWGHVVLDSLHAARRAQALDSNMKSSNLKYATKYLNLNKPNRVYVPGDKINKTWAITDEVFGFCEEDGDWYTVTEKRPLLPGYELKSGRYIVERYLLDDLWETEKVEEKLNESNFLVGKMLPTTFTRPEKISIRTARHAISGSHTLTGHGSIRLQRGSHSTS